MGVIALVMGGIWAAREAVRRRQSLEDSVQILQEVADNIRTLYAGHGLPLPAGCTDGTQAVCDVTATLVANGSIFPRQIVRTVGANSLPFNPWDGRIYTNFVQNNPSIYGVDFDVPSTEVCVSFLSRLQANPDNQEGLPISISYAAGAVWTTVKGDDWVGGGGTVNLSPSEIVDSVNAAGGCVSVGFRFQI